LKIKKGENIKNRKEDVVLNKPFNEEEYFG
jgi:hypothetical protein